jgi:hypothetical protein
MAIQLLGALASAQELSATSLQNGLKLKSEFVELMPVVSRS